jgi:hypothetical protein
VTRQLYNNYDRLVSTCVGENCIATRLKIEIAKGSDERSTSASPRTESTVYQSLRAHNFPPKSPVNKLGCEYCRIAEKERSLRGVESRRAPRHPLSLIGSTCNRNAILIRWVCSHCRRIITRRMKKSSLSNESFSLSLSLSLLLFRGGRRETSQEHVCARVFADACHARLPGGEKS